MRDWKAELRPRLASLHLPPAREASILDELSQHLEDRREALIAGGADDETATALTLAELERADLLAPRLGALAQARWQPPPAPGVPNQRALAGAWQDLRYAARTLRRDPLFTGIAVLTLTCGIGLNTAMFGFMNALLFRPLPFAEPAQLVRLVRTTAERQAGGFSAAEYLALRRAEDGFGRFAAFRPSSRALADAARSSEWLDVSAELFDVLGVQPAMGRAFRADDEVPGNHRVVLISTALWQDQFGGAADVVGRSLQATDGPYEIVGVLPPAATDHRLFGRVGIFSPLSLDAAARANRTTRTIAVLGRRGPAVTAAQADVFLTALAAQAAADAPEASVRTAWRSERLPDSVTGPDRTRPAGDAPRPVRVRAAGGVLEPGQPAAGPGHRSRPRVRRPHRPRRLATAADPDRAARIRAGGGRRRHRRRPRRDGSHAVAPVRRRRPTAGHPSRWTGASWPSPPWSRWRPCSSAAWRRRCSPDASPRTTR